MVFHILLPIVYEKSTSRFRHTSPVISRYFGFAVSPIWRVKRPYLPFVALLNAVVDSCEQRASTTRSGRKHVDTNLSSFELTRFTSGRIQQLSSGCRTRRRWLAGEITNVTFRRPVYTLIIIINIHVYRKMYTNLISPSTAENEYSGCRSCAKKSRRV